MYLNIAYIYNRDSTNSGTISDSWSKLFQENPNL